MWARALGERGEREREREEAPHARCESDAHSLHSTHLTHSFSPAPLSVALSHPTLLKQCMRAMASLAARYLASTPTTPRVAAMRAANVNAG